jgi:glycerophosphoryl diester phosphodiesterase
VENSWGAFERAVALGYVYVETDLRATADGVAVAFHDPELGRMLGASGDIATTTWAALSEHPLADDRPVPRLDELLASWPHVRWNLDIKAAAAVAPVVTAVAQAGAEDRVLVTAFAEKRSLQARKLAGPGLATGGGRVVAATLLVSSYTGGLARPWLRGACATQVPVSRWGVKILRPEFLHAAHRAGLQVHVWTIDQSDEMEALLDMGVDGLMTDRPSVLKQVLVARGAGYGP